MNLYILKGGAIVNSIFWITLFLIPLYSWMHSEGDISDYFAYSVPQGQLLYVICKLFGLFALVLLWLHMGYALVRHSILSHLIVPWSIKKHRGMALVSLALVTFHVLLFFVAVSMRKEEIALGLFLPSFSQGIYKTLLSFGLIAFYLIFFVAFIGRLIFYCKKSQSVFLWLHRLSFVCFILIYLHGLGVGSETKSGILFGFYVFMGLSLLLLLTLRIISPKPNLSTKENIT